MRSKRSIKLAKTVAFVLALNAVASTPAHCQDVRSFIQGLAGKYVISWADLDSKIADLDSQITQGASAGQLTASQAADFRAELKKIQQAEVQAKAAGKRMSIPQVIDFSNQLNALTSGVQDAASKTVSSLPDVDALSKQLSAQVDAALSAGQLNAQAASTLRAQLQHQSDIEAAYKSETQGDLTPRQIELLAESLNKIKADIDQQTKISQSAIPALNDHKVAIEKKIQSAIDSGRLSAAEVEGLRRQLAAIASEQASFQASGNGILNGSQVLRLAQEFDKVEQTVDLKLAGGAVTGSVGQIPPGVDAGPLDALRDQIANRINSLASSGRLSAMNAARNTHDLDAIVSEEQQFIGAGLTKTEFQKLLRDLGALNNRIDAQIEVSALPPGGNIGGSSSGSYGGSNGSSAGGRFNVANLPIIGSKNFSDMSGYWGQQYVQELATRGVIGGFPDGSFRPNAEITRGQFASIVAHALNLQSAASGRFNDVPAGYWAAGVIGAASNAGLITGFPDGTFRPEDKITRAQALVILSKALRGASSDASALGAYSDASSVPGWAQPSVASAANAHIIVSFPDANQIRPNALATRGDVAALMYQTLTALGADLPRLRLGLMANN